MTESHTLIDYTMDISHPYVSAQDDDDKGIDIYKYRRRKAEDNQAQNATDGLPDVDSTSINSKKSGDGENRPKTYAILQEGRTDFNNSKLRSLLLIYSNSAWRIFILATLIIAFILNTTIYAFFKPLERPFWAIMILICLNLIFVFDVVIVVGLKLSKKWRKTLNLMEPKTIMVLLNVILAFPYSFMYLLKSNEVAFNFHAIAPIIATIRVYRVVEYFYDRSSEAGSNQWTTFLFQYLILFCLSVHTWTCVWYLFANKSFDVHKIQSSWSLSAIYLPTERTIDWYYVCTYWSVMYLTTNALGDLYPVTTIERLTSIMAILVGFLLTTVVFVGSLTSQFITITTRRSKYVRQLTKIKNHLRLINMDADTSRRIIRYYEDVWYQKSGVFKPKLLGMLPYPLQMEICYDLNAVPLYSSLVFRQLPEAFLRRLSLNMTHQFYLPGDVVYSHNQNKTIMVCVTSGVLELLSDEDDESPMISFSKGTCFGEISLVYNIPARCTVKAATYVECQVLEKTKFIKLMITYPNLVDHISKEIKERLARAKRRKLIEAEHAEFSLNIYASKDRKKSSIKCLKDKLRYLQGQTDIDKVTKEDELDENCLDLYIMSEHVKKKTVMFTCLQSHFPWILVADCPLVRYWELYMLAIVGYISIFYPYYIGYRRSFPDGVSFYAQIIITISLIVNIFMTSITSVKTKKKSITDFKSILNYRMSTLGFYLDLVAIVPFEYIVMIHATVKYHDNYRNHLFYLCKGLKLILVWRIASFFDSMEKKLLLNAIMIKVVKYCVYIFLLCYWSGVILYMESCFVTRCSENSWFGKAIIWENQNVVTSHKTEHPIITSVYFATTILLAVGYGDFTPGDFYDMAFIAFLSLYGVLLSGYCISEFSAVVTHWSRTKTSFLEVIMTIDKFMKENNMHPAIKSRIMAFYELQWQYNSGVELTDDNWLEKTVVPLELRKKVLHQARFKALTSIKFFQVKNKAYIQTLTETATDIILPPGEIVFYGGTVTRELYIIESGYCLVTSKELRESKKERVIGPGNHLGLLVLLYGVPSVSTVITLTHCKLICVSHYAYISALSLFPDMKEHEGLMTPEELKMIERKAKSQCTDSYLQYYNRIKEGKPKARITNILQDFFNNSFIDLTADYKKKKESYWKSYKQFKFLNNIAPYILMPIVMKPDGIFLKVWASMRIGVAFLLCLMIPVIVSMAPLYNTLNIPLVFLETICYIDMYLMLHVAYYGPKNQLIYHPYLTAKHYLQGQFVVDIFTCFPWYALWLLFVPKHDENHTEEDHEVNAHLFHCALRMINVLQIIKLYAASGAESIGALRRAYIMSVVHFSLLTLFFFNLYASILITLTCRYVLASDAEDYERIIERLSRSQAYIKAPFQPSGNMICLEGSWLDGTEILKTQAFTPTKVYLLAYYWAATSFGGAGFGDIVPQSVDQMILFNSLNLHGVLFFGYVYARIASLKAMADQVVTKFQENLKHLELFLNREKVPFSLKKSILDYWKYQWKRTRGWSHQSILGKLHANLNEDAVLHMYEKTLREIPLFEDVEYSFFRAFAKKLTERYFQKGYTVIKANEVITTMYIIYRGKVDVMSSVNEVEACMGPGGIFGNIKGANRYLTMSNVIASRNIDVLCIEGRDFYALLKSYPTVLRKVTDSVKAALKDYVLPTVCALNRGSVDPHYLFLSSYESSEDEEDNDLVTNKTESPEKSIAESHGSRSLTSANCPDYEQAHWLLFKPHRWFRSSIVPDCTLMTFMDYLILFISYVDFVLLVYQMTFLSVPYFFYICLVFDLIFMYKLFLDLHCGYMNRYGDYVLNPQKVRKMFFSKTYLRRRDFLSMTPLCYFVFALSLSPTMKMSLFCYTRTPQLARISYLFTYRTHRKTNIGGVNLLFKLSTIGIWATILSHVNACLFFKLSCLSPVHCTSANWMSKPELNLRAKYSEENYFALYVAALWYVINLLTITGTGDVTAQNSFEVVETIIVIVIIKFCTGLLISEMSAMVTAHSSSRIAYDYDIHELRDGLRDMDLSVHQMNKMWDYVRELWNRQQGKQMPKLIYMLPFRLRCQVMEALYGSHIRESVIFSKTDRDFRRMLVMWMRHCVFFPGNYIVQCGDSDQCIYFIHRGQVEVLTVHPNLTESIYDVLEPEDSFGIAQGLFVGVAHHFSFRARTVVDIVYLKLDQWKYLLEYYPNSAKLVRRKVENVYLAI